MVKFLVKFQGGEQDLEVVLLDNGDVEFTDCSRALGLVYAKRQQICSGVRYIAKEFACTGLNYDNGMTINRVN